MEINFQQSGNQNPWLTTTKIRLLMFNVNGVGERGNLISSAVNGMENGLAITFQILNFEFNCVTSGFIILGELQNIYYCQMHQNPKTWKLLEFWQTCTYQIMWPSQNVMSAMKCVITRVHSWNATKRIWWKY